MRAISLLFHDVYVASPRESGFESSAADRYKLSLDNFDAQLAGVARVRAEAPVVVATGDVTGGLKASGDPKVASDKDIPYLITVDDGGVSYHTLVADRLEAKGWRGHCFISTDAIGTAGFLDVAQIRELDARGHVIGSHSVSHPARFSACGAERMHEEWLRSRKLLEDLLGHEVAVASVPGGYYSPLVAQTARDAGLRVLFTSEPTIVSRQQSGILVMGRFTLRHAHSTDMARQLLQRAPWMRYRQWASWNAKSVIKSLLGPAYARAADWWLGGSERRTKNEELKNQQLTHVRRSSSTVLRS
jgi:peptidoglycan/xylan/chitin deacetylase (PgdA/CDA1 family)